MFEEFTTESSVGEYQPLEYEEIFPHVIDNTMRSAFVDCERKFYYAHILGLQPRVPSIHLHAGAAFAYSLEMTRRAFYEKGFAAMEAEAIGAAALLEAYGDFDIENGYGTDHTKSKHNMLRAFRSYFIEYPLGADTIVPHRFSDDRFGLEFSFSIPMNIRHPVTGDPILYAGKFDMLGDRENSIWVVDEKTTGALGSTWAQQWDLASQFTGYCCGARTYGIPVAGAIIRGIGILKSDIKHQQVILSRSDWVIDRWWNQLHKDTERMLECWRKKDWGFNLGSSCSNYGGCTYKKIDTVENFKEWAPMSFTIRRWDPLGARE